MPNVYDRLAELGLTLPEPAAPIANFVPFVQTGNLLYVSGQGPRTADGPAHDRQGGAGAQRRRGL